MDMGSKPLIIAAALALGASGAALAGGAAEGATSAYPGQPSVVAAPLPDPAYRADEDAYRGDDARDRAARDEALEDEAADDASERAERAARTSQEEEHGGLRNWFHDKKDEARRELDMAPDRD